MVDQDRIRADPGNGIEDGLGTVARKQALTTHY